MNLLLKFALLVVRTRRREGCCGHVSLCHILVPQLFLFTDVSVAGFSLVNSATNEVISAVASGDTLDLDDLEETYGVDEFSIVCNTQGPVESVQFVEDFTLPNDGDNTNEETTVNEAPYQLDGNLAAGEYSVSCQPFCEDDLGGASSDAATVDFTVTQLDCSTCTAACIAITGTFRLFVCSLFVG